jgi:hypothetical protein
MGLAKALHAMVRRPSLSLAITLGLLATMGSSSCGKRRETPTSEQERSRVPSPLENPAGHCRDSCPLKVHCRLGQLPKALFDAEVERCRDGCLTWIKDHPQEAAALWPCYEERLCGAQRACLAEVGRILEDRVVPAKVKECDEMCVTLGTCQGDAIDCRLRCRTGAVSVYRALYRCANKNCPELRDCIEALFSGRMERPTKTRPTALDNP